MSNSEILNKNGDFDSKKTRKETVIEGVLVFLLLAVFAGFANGFADFFQKNIRDYAAKEIDNQKRELLVKVTSVASEWAVSGGKKRMANVSAYSSCVSNSVSGIGTTPAKCLYIADDKELIEVVKNVINQSHYKKEVKDFFLR